MSVYATEDLSLGSQQGNITDTFYILSNKQRKGKRIERMYFQEAPPSNMYLWLEEALVV